MKTLRSLHLYLGCAFAPLLVFFCVTGLGQLYVPAGDRPAWMTLLSSIHTARGLKTGDITTLSSPAMRALAGLMAAGLMLTIILGVVMAFRTGRARTALVALAIGVIVPFALVVITILS